MRGECHLDVEEEVKHALAQAEGGGEGGGRANELLGLLLREPRGGELALHVLAVEEVAEEQLVPAAGQEGAPSEDRGVAASGAVGRLAGGGVWRVVASGGWWRLAGG